MKRTTLALACLSLIVSASAFAQANASASQQTAKPAPPKTIVQIVRDALNAKDFERAELLAVAEMANSKESPISIEAFSWLARDLVSRKRYDEAMTYASRTYGIVEEQLKRRKLDDEPRLPIALGAAIEVQAQALAGQGRRSEALMHLQREMDLYKGTSIIMRLNKNMHMISLAGQPALPVATATEWLPGPKPPAFTELKGKPVVLFLWAHWCGDCKTQGPLLEAVVNKYKDSGIVVIAPTQRFGYAEKRRPVGPAEELKYIEQVRDQFYPWMKNVSVPVSDEVYLKYGVSTTPTYVMIDREGKVSTYLPGQPTIEEIDALVRKIAGPAPTLDK
ncbi:MAG TPA: TlpA disulfide reductase family protein [Vicinamibacterales bacterium]|nr:TlpA disulfide reductase family protein [Vicinamibacterales bacterium]